MDGRGAILCAVALLLGASGCIPSSSKNTSIESSALPPAEQEASTRTTSFLSSTKREPRVELALAFWREKKANTLRDKPEQQYRELDEARKIYQEILNYDANNIEAIRGLGRTYVALSDFERATAIYRNAIEKHPREGWLHAEFSVVYSKRNQFDEAIRKLSKASELEPENQDFLRMLGVNYVCAGQIDRGVETLARARGPAAAHYYVARLLYLKNQPDAARQHVRQALEANPNLAEAQALAAEMDQGMQSPGDRPRQGLDIQFAAEEK